MFGLRLLRGQIHTDVTVLVPTVLILSFKFLFSMREYHFTVIGLVFII